MSACYLKTSQNHVLLQSDEDVHITIVACAQDSQNGHIYFDKLSDVPMCMGVSW